MDVLSRERATPAQVFEALQDRDEEDLKRRQKSTLEYLRKHATVTDQETVDELVDELSEYDSFTEDQILKIIDVLPQSEREVRSLFSKERIKLEDEDIDRVIDFAESIEAPE